MRVSGVSAPSQDPIARSSDVTPSNAEIQHQQKSCKRGHPYKELPQCPICKAASHQKWVERNRAHLRSSRRRRYLLNKKAVIRKAIKWRQDNFEHYTDTRKKREATPEYRMSEWRKRESNRERGVWRGMIERCSNPASTSYPDYGARGIRVCRRWMKFDNFLADMGKRPGQHYTIERMDNTKGYSLTNCRWATRREQARNRSTNRFLEFDGKRMCLKDWADELGVTIQLLTSRLDRNGWGVERALTTGPVKRWANG